MRPSGMMCPGLESSGCSEYQSRTTDTIKGRTLKNVQFCSRSRKTKILTTGIHLVFRGLKFESDAEIGQKGMFLKALRFKKKGEPFMLTLFIVLDIMS